MYRVILSEYSQITGRIKESVVFESDDKMQAAAFEQSMRSCYCNGITSDVWTEEVK